MTQWRLAVTADFEKELKAAVGRDAKMQQMVKKKIDKIREDPERAGDGKVGPLRGLRAVRVTHYVILFDIVADPTNPPGVVNVRHFWHHNDRRYDP